MMDKLFEKMGIKSYESLQAFRFWMSTGIFLSIIMMFDSAFDRDTFIMAIATVAGFGYTTLRIEAVKRIAKIDNDRGWKR